MQILHPLSGRFFFYHPPQFIHKKCTFPFLTILIRMMLNVIAVGKIFNYILMTSTIKGIIHFT